jgi:hypothetical protein
MVQRHTLPCTSSSGIYRQHREMNLSLSLNLNPKLKSNRMRRMPFLYKDISFPCNIHPDNCTRRV